MAVRPSSHTFLFGCNVSPEERYKKGTPTIGTSIEDYQTDNNNYRFYLTDENQIDAIEQNIFLLFKKIALPFYEKFNSLEKVDKALNIDLEDTSLTGDIFKGSKSLIVAKLIGRDNYKELEGFYLQYHKEFANGFYFPDFKKLTKFLEGFTINSTK